MVHNGHVSMTKRDFIKEHTDLTKTLNSGNKAALAKEYREQSAELKAVKSKAKQYGGK